MTRAQWFWLCITLAFLIFLFLIRAILLPFVLGALVAYLLDPLTDRLEGKHLSRGSATALVTVMFFLLLGLVTVLVLPVLARQLAGFIEAIPAQVAALEQQYGHYAQRLLGALPVADNDDLKTLASNASGMVLQLIGNFLGGLATSGFAVLNLLSLILITPVVAFYLLRDWDVLVQQIDQLLPRKHADVIREQLQRIDDTLSGFLRGQLNVCLLLGTYYAIGLSLAGLNFGFVIGLVTGLLTIFPYVGLLVGMTTGMVMALVQFDSATQIGIVLAVYVTGQIMEGYYLTPKLVGGKVGLHPVWIIFGMLAGGALFGLVGVLIAVPMTAVIGVLIRFAIGRYQQSAYYRGTP